MNRRGFLRGAISVMALAAVIKGRTIASSHGHELDLDTGKVTTTVVNEFAPGDMIRIVGDNTYRIRSVVNGVLTLG